MTDVAFLKEEVGVALSLGIAEVVAANPRDPVGYLGHWLLHYLEKKSIAETRIQEERQAEVEREKRAKLRLEEERISAAVLQREWRAHQGSMRERARKETELIELFQELSATAEERYNVEDAVATATAAAAGEGGLDATERELVAVTVHADVLLQRSVLFLEGLTKAHIAALKYTTNPTPLLHRVMRCALYLVEDKTPANVGYGEDWNACRACIKPNAFLLHLRAYQPLKVAESGAPKTSKRVIERVRRLLKGFTDDAVRSDPVGGMSLFVLFQFVRAAVEARRAYDEHVQHRKVAEKDTVPSHRLFSDGALPAIDAWDCVEVVEASEGKDVEEEPIRLEEAEEAEAMRRAKLEENPLQDTEGGAVEDEEDAE